MPTVKESSPLLASEQPPQQMVAAVRLYHELGSVSLALVSMLTLTSLALNVLVLTPKVIFLTVDFLPSVSSLPSTQMQEQVGVWIGSYTIFHTINLLAKKRMYFLVVILVSWSIVFPFVKLLWLLSVLFRPRRPSSGQGYSTAAEVGWLAQLGRWSLLDVVFVLLIQVLLTDEKDILTLDILITKITFGVRATMGEGMLLFPLAILLSMAAVAIVEVHLLDLADPASPAGPADSVGGSAASEAAPRPLAAAAATADAEPASALEKGGEEAKTADDATSGGTVPRPWLANALIYGRDCRDASAGPAQAGALLAILGLGLTITTFFTPLFTVGDMNMLASAGAAASSARRMLYDTEEAAVRPALLPLPGGLPGGLPSGAAGEFAAGLTGGAVTGHVMAALPGSSVAGSLLVGDMAEDAPTEGGLTPGAIAKLVHAQHNRWSLATALGRLTREQGTAMGVFSAGVVVFMLVVPLGMFAALLTVLLVPQASGDFSRARAAARLARFLSSLSLLEVLFVGILIYLSQAAQHLFTLNLGPAFVSLAVLMAVMPAAFVLTQRALDAVGRQSSQQHGKR